MTQAEIVEYFPPSDNYRPPRKLSVKDVQEAKEAYVIRMLLQSGAAELEPDTAEWVQDEMQRHQREYRNWQEVFWLDRGRRVEATVEAHKRWMAWDAEMSAAEK